MQAICGVLSNFGPEATFTGRPAAAHRRAGDGDQDVDMLLVAALTQHHKYLDGGCLNLEPAGVRQLAASTSISKNSVSRFFKRVFEGHRDSR